MHSKHVAKTCKISDKNAANCNHVAENNLHDGLGLARIRGGLLSWTNQKGKSHMSAKAGSPDHNWLEIQLKI